MTPYIIGICGSTRTGSSNHALLAAAARLLAEHTLNYEGWRPADSIAALPHFVPSNDEPTHTAVLQFRTLLAGASSILICTPEYAHGIPGSLKNALDWLVATVVTQQKPVAVWTAAPSGGQFAHPQLIEVLQTMSADIRYESSLQITNARGAVQLDGTITDDVLRACLQESIMMLWQQAMRFHRSQQHT